MSADPSTADLETIQARLRQGARRECWSVADGRLVAHVLPSDLDALLTAYDALAARLAAVEVERDRVIERAKRAEGFIANMVDLEGEDDEARDGGR